MYRYRDTHHQMDEKASCLLTWDRTLANIDVLNTPHISDKKFNIFRHLPMWAIPASNEYKTVKKQFLGKGYKSFDKFIWLVKKGSIALKFKCKHDSFYEK